MIYNSSLVQVIFLKFVEVDHHYIVNLSLNFQVAIL